MSDRKNFSKKLLGGKKMKKIMIIVMALTMLVNSAFAGLSYSGDVVSRYIFRGVDFGDPVNYYNEKGNYNNSPAFQPGIKYSFGETGLYVGFWGSMGLGSYSSQEMDEADLYAGYDFSLGGIDYTLGYTHYTFPSLELYKQRVEDMSAADAKDMLNTDEVWFGLALPNVILQPSLKVYYDYDRSKFNTNEDGGDETSYAYTELGFVLPAVYSLDQSIMFCFDGSKYSAGLTNINYRLAKELPAGFSAYTNLIYINKSAGALGFVSGVDEYKEDGVTVKSRKGVNEDAYEIVVGISYSGDLF